MNVRYPGPSVGGNTDLQPKLIDLLLLHSPRRCQTVSRQAPADRAAISCSAASIPKPGATTATTILTVWAPAASRRRTATDGEITRHSNCRNTPVEVFEHRYPLLTLTMDWRQDSGGAGKHRGGLGTERTMRVTAPEITFSALFDRHKLTSTGLFGGGPGGPSQLMVKLAGTSEFRSFKDLFGTRSPTKFTNVVLHAGDELYYCTPGGAGFGPPTERDAEAMREDVRDGYVSAAAAKRDYGVTVPSGDRS